MDVENTKTITIPIDMGNNFVKPTIIIVVIFILIYIFFSPFLGNNSFKLQSNANTPQGNSVSFFLLFVVVGLILLYLIPYFYNSTFELYLRNIFTFNTLKDLVPDLKEEDESQNQDPEPNTSSSNSLSTIKYKKQVYNIPGNHYSYDNAKAVCKAYGAELATYNQIEEAYNKGAEWCNYGWSENQMAFFPTQQKTYDNLQKISGHKNDCGRPGINGGYIANPNVRFGVNCYGYKPNMTKEENKLMQSVTPYPEKVQDQSFQKKVDFWKTKIDTILISPFNYNSWTTPIV